MGKLFNGKKGFPSRSLFVFFSQQNFILPFVVNSYRDWMVWNACEYFPINYALNASTLGYISKLQAPK